MSASPDAFEETCENCRFLAADDTCGNPDSVYHLRPAVYRDGDEVLQAGWCDLWELQPSVAPAVDVPF